MWTERDLFDAVDETWPAAAVSHVDGWTIRDGRGGGQRVSAASGFGNVSVAEAAMVASGQDRLFMIQGDQAELDAELADRGYVVKDPVDLLVGDSATIADGFRPKLDAIFAEFPLPILAEIWAEGGIGPARLDVMERTTCAKTFVMGRIDARAAAAAFVAASNGVCMAHAVEVLARERRRGVAEKMMRAAAWWGLQHGAKTFCVLTTQANISAQKLYRKMGMETATQYHYRIKT